MVHDSSGQCSFRRMYTKHRFVLVRMQLSNLANTWAVKCFKRYRGYAVHIRY